MIYHSGLFLIQDLSFSLSADGQVWQQLIRVSKAHTTNNNRKSMKAHLVIKIRVKLCVIYCELLSFFDIPRRDVSFLV